MNLSNNQIEQLLKPINRNRVKTLDGMAHLEAWDVRAMLIRIFGFGGFSLDLVDLALIHDLETSTRAGKAARKVAYRATVTLTIHDLGCTYTEAAVGESVMPEFKWGDAHDMAIKTAESQALKRCSVNLGDQFGLSLYNGGSMNAVIVAVVAEGSGNLPEQDEPVKSEPVPNHDDPEPTDAPAFVEPEGSPPVTPSESIDWEEVARNIAALGAITDTNERMKALTEQTTYVTANGGKDIAVKGKNGPVTIGAVLDMALSGAFVPKGA
jgi:hypothetical protein